MTAEAYLRELARELGLRTPHVRRVLLEVEDHLRASARELGEEEAVARFGAPRELAASFAREALVRITRWTSYAVDACILATVAAYLAVENGSPPAPWPTADAAPDYLRWKIWAAERLIAAGFAAGALALVARERVRFRLALSWVALVTLGAAGALAAAEAFQRAAVYRELGVDGTPIDLAIAAVVAGQLLPVAAGVLFGARAVAWLRLSAG